MDLIGILPNRYSRRREKVFGKGRCQPLDRNAKARITVYARAWSARHKRPGQHRGPLTRAYLEVLAALLWGFHNSRDGRCFPSYEAIAERAQCCRDTVYEAIKALEAAGIMTWVNRLVRVQFREKDLFGNLVPRTRLIRTSNAYVFRDPLSCASHPNPVDRGRGGGQKTTDSVAVSSKSENPPGTQNQDFYNLSTEPNGCETPPSEGLGRALKRLQTAMRMETAIA
ncbi:MULTISPECIES: helix-turn-helix domain-containing protein [Acidiphilium]|uniref:Helix-turn-helix domain-containing protein n=1 Tax=Acidiphilium rubrum TaxID=526 RepID=A0A8G2FF57_ACIRU|nr:MULTISPECIES: helix-turn-helix domain-containing protein [Acidiphilium]SIR53365.1 Helix-turn-helix domain-containing protein [Acidiphilium rubrum]